MKQQGIPGVKYIPLPLTQVETAELSGQTLASVQNVEEEVASQGYGYRLTTKVWMFAQPFAADPNWEPPQRQ